MLHHLPCGVDAALAVVYGVVNIALPIITLEKRVCSVGIEFLPGGIADASCTLHEKGAVVAEVLVRDRDLHAVSATDISQNSHVEIGALTPETQGGTAGRRL